MAIEHTFLTYKDVNTLTNKGVATLSYTLQRNACGEMTTTMSGTLALNQSVILKMPLTGKYEFTFRDGVNPDIQKIIYNFEKILEDTICVVQDILCGQVCVDCDSNCETTSTVFSKLMLYNQLNLIKYTEYMVGVSTVFFCYSENLIYDNEYKEQLTGESNHIGLLKQNIAFLYSVFYFQQLSKAIDQAEIDYIKIKFKSALILPCIRTLGLPIGLNGSLPDIALLQQNNFVRVLTIYKSQLSGVGTIEEQVCAYILTLPIEQRVILETDSKWNIEIIDDTLLNANLFSPLFNTLFN